MTAAGGFLLAANGKINIVAFIATLLGLSAVISSACVCNNIIDQSIDKKMVRTKKRALVTGEVTLRGAAIFATILLLSGAAILFLYSNLLATIIALFGFIAYVFLYGYFKRRTVYGTEVGSISGAIPPVVGYCAVTNQLNGGAIILFLILIFWQMPHFYAIGIFRLKDYTAAGLPILPAVKGIETTKIRILCYIVAFILTVPTLTLFGYAGMTYLIVMFALAIAWVFIGLKDYRRKDDNAWAGKMFGLSLVVLTAFSFLISINAWIP